MSSTAHLKKMDLIGKLHHIGQSLFKIVKIIIGPVGEENGQNITEELNVVGTEAFLDFVESILILIESSSIIFINSKT